MPENAALDIGSSTHSEEIPRSQWSSYLKAFSGQHRDWLAILDISGGTRDLPVLSGALHGLEMDGDGVSIVLADSRKQEIDTRVEKIERVRVRRTAEGAESAVEFDASTEHATLRLRTPMPPEMVDGVV